MIALGIVVVIALLFIFFIALRRRSPATLRRIPAFDRLNREIGLAVENGTRLHISLGRGNFFTARGGSALAGLAAVCSTCSHRCSTAIATARSWTT